jgi:hypothetical protein
MTINLRIRKRILKQLRAAVDHQIKLWDLGNSLAKDLDLELDDVLSEVQTQSITADTGMDLTEEDLEDFLAVQCRPPVM